MRSNIPTERIISLVEEITELSIAYDMLRDALPDDLSAELPPKPALVQYNIELNRPIDYAKRVESQRQRMRRIRAKLGEPKTAAQRREESIEAEAQADPKISVEDVINAIEKSERVPVKKVKIEI
jgi:hypothetical protein